jgi:hypothetical protein
MKCDFDGSGMLAEVNGIASKLSVVNNGNWIWSAVQNDVLESLLRDKSL